jgi:catechol 2,3-dioxygenase-like lactoylglutathione lyase family enzyme
VDVAGQLVGGRLVQIAFVVPDVRAALERYDRVLGPRRWRCYRFSSDRHSSCSYRGEPAEFAALVALDDGSPQLELIQPLAGRTVHTDWLSAGGDGVHHLGVLVDSVQESIERMERAGYRVIQAGEGFGAAGDGSYAYFDTARDLGVDLEAIEPASAMREPEFVWPGGA